MLAALHRVDERATEHRPAVSQDPNAAKSASASAWSRSSAHLSNVGSNWTKRTLRHFITRIACNGDGPGPVRMTELAVRADLPVEAPAVTPRVPMTSRTFARDAGAWFGNYLEGEDADGDLARAMLKAFSEAVMSAQGSAQCGAAYNERSEDRRTPATAIGDTS